jgi:IS30 family transposase
MKAHLPKDWSQNELRRLKAAAKSKASAEDIAKALGRHVGPVKRMARELGVILFKKAKARAKG